MTDNVMIFSRIWTVGGCFVQWERMMVCVCIYDELTVFLFLCIIHLYCTVTLAAVQ